MNKKVLIVIPIVIVLALGVFFAYNYYFHVLGGPKGDGTALCTSYLKGDCLYDATYSSSTNDLTVYGLGQITGNTMYNVGFAYAPADAKTNSQHGPVGAVFQPVSSLSGNALNSGEHISMITFNSINASAPASYGYNGDIYVAYTTSNSGSDCVGPIASLTSCSFFAIAQINLK